MRVDNQVWNCADEDGNHLAQACRDLQNVVLILDITAALTKYREVYKFAPAEVRPAPMSVPAAISDCNGIHDMGQAAAVLNTA